jgi:hypothetical protein
VIRPSGICAERITLTSIQPAFATGVYRQFADGPRPSLDVRRGIGLYLVWKGILDLGDDSLKADLLPGTLYMMILRTLNQGPLHGYAIGKRIRDWSKGELEIEDGSLYPALNRMLTKGWLKAEWGKRKINERRVSTA